MKATPARILLVDDDDLNLEILVEYLKDKPYELVPAHDGEGALKLLRADQQGFHALVLDRMMPGINGLEVLTQLKADERLKWLPVVMQTSAGFPHEICEGIEAGVFFYLTKPFQQEVLLRIISAAVEEGLKWKRIFRKLGHQSRIVELLQQGRFRIRTMDEAYDLAMLLGRACPDSEKAVFGLNELLANGVEHGNLGIGFDEKTQLQETERWDEEIQHRLALPENAHKFVEVLFERLSERIKITITDQGQGFDWRQYERINPDRMLESHGRGIAMTKSLSFSQVEYQGIGNTVVCVLESKSTTGQECVWTAVPTSAIHSCSEIVSSRPTTNDGRS